MQVIPFLTFNGNCREAMEFYKQCFGADLNVMRVGDAPGNFPAEAKDLVMHATLRKGPEFLMGADTWGGTPFQPGNTFSVAIQLEDLAETTQDLGALGEGGKVTMPLQDMFWGARFGMLTDRFGIQWMLNCALPK